MDPSDTELASELRDGGAVGTGGKIYHTSNSSTDGNEVMKKGLIYVVRIDDSRERLARRSPW